MGLGTANCDSGMISALEVAMSHLEPIVISLSQYLREKDEFFVKLSAEWFNFLIFSSPLQLSKHGKIVIFSNYLLIFSQSKVILTNRWGICFEENQGSQR
jgi:hypothetical protein